MKIGSQIVSLIFAIFVTSLAHGGFSSDSDYKSYHKYKHNFQYEIEGEIEVKPNAAHLPVTVKTTDKSYTSALGQSQKVLDALTKELKQMDESSFSISPTDFFKPKQYSKKIDISFFKKDDDKVISNLNLYITIAFSDDDSFWEKAKRIATAMDFLQSFSKKYDSNDDIIIFQEPIFYDVQNKEDYREQIIRSIYVKAKKVADIIGTSEQKKVTIKEAQFDQHIKEDIPDFSKALLSIKAYIAFSFE